MIHWKRYYNRNVANQTCSWSLPYILAYAPFQVAMALHASSRTMLLLLAATAFLWMALHSPLLAQLFAALTGICGPVLEPTSRWNDWWGMGWLAFHNKLAKEVAVGDKGQVITAATIKKPPGIWILSTNDTL
jgi:hypothetical protein